MSPPLTSSTRSADGARSRNVTSRLAAMSGDTTGGGAAGGAAAGCASSGAAMATSIEQGKSTLKNLPCIAFPTA